MKDLLSGLMSQLGNEQPKIKSLEDLKNQPKQFFSVAGAAIVEKIMAELAAGLQDRSLNPTDFDHVMGISARGDEIAKLMLEGSTQINAVAQAFAGTVADNGLDSMVTESEDAVELHLNLDPNDMFLILSMEANKAKLTSAMNPYWIESKRIFSQENIKAFCLNPSFPYVQKLALLDNEINGIKIVLGFTSGMIDFLQKMTEDGSIITSEIIAKRLQESAELPEELVSFKEKMSNTNAFVTMKQDEYLTKLFDFMNLKAQVTTLAQ